MQATRLDESIPASVEPPVADYAVGVPAPTPARFRAIGHGLLDAAMLVIAFLAADLLRCLLWQNTPWPQRPLNIYQDWYWYLWVLPPLAVIWPIVVASLGLHGPMNLLRRASRAAVAGALLLSVYSTMALFFSRLAHPRMQIVLTSLLAPAGFYAGWAILYTAARISRWMKNIGLPDYSVY